MRMPRPRFATRLMARQLTRKPVKLCRSVSACARAPEGKGTGGGRHAPEEGDARE